VSDLPLAQPQESSRATPAQVYVVGEALIDIVHLDGGKSEHPGGSPTNVAYGLGLLGVDTTLLAHFGDDDRGRVLVRHIESAGVRIAPESLSADRTSTAAAEIDDTGSAHYVFDIDWSLPDSITVPPVAIIHTGSIATFLEPGASAVRRLLAEARGAALVTYDPNIRPALVGDHARAVATFEATARLCTVVKLSDEDAEWLYPEEKIEDTLNRILQLGPVLAVVTRGGDGSLLFTRAARVELPSARVNVVDTIGAGDTYMASLIDSLLHLDPAHLSTADLRRMGERASAAAGITVSRAGAALPNRAEVDARLDETITT